MLNVALTHDVDRITKTYQHITKFIKAMKKGRWKDAYYHLNPFLNKDTYFNIPLLIKDEQKLGVKSTFFFLHETLKFNLWDIRNWSLSLGRYSLEDKKIIDIILWLDKNGWEVALHGSYNSYNNYELMKYEKQLLENILNHEILGIRQHHLNMNEETWSIQGKCGFTYDSSFGFNEKIGFKNERYNYFSPIKNNLIIFPMIIMDKPFCSNFSKWDELQRIIDICVKKNSLLVVNWHSNNYHPREFPEYRDDYIRIIEECKKDTNKFYTLRDYYYETVKKTKN